jgi:hypothetical protein
VSALEGHYTIREWPGIIVLTSITVTSANAAGLDHQKFRRSRTELSASRLLQKYTTFGNLPKRTP